MGYFERAIEYERTNEFYLCVFIFPFYANISYIITILYTKYTKV